MDARNITRAGLPLAVGLTALLVGGCATTDCDPSKGGYLRGIGCTVGGGYRERQDIKQGAVETERVRQEDLRRQYSDAKAEQDVVRKQREAAERRYASLKRDLDDLRSRLRQGKVENRRLEEEIAALKGQVDLLQKDNVTPASEKDARLKDLQRQKEALERQVELSIAN